MMNIKDIFALEYRVGSKCFILGKSELRCIDQSHSENNFSIPLNQIDPYYSYGGDLPFLRMLLAVYLLIGCFITAISWLNGKHVLDHSSIQLIIYPILLILIGHPLYKHFKEVRAYRFTYLRDQAFAFSLPVTRKNKVEAENFVNTLISRVNDAPPSNEHILFLLQHFGLLTNPESTQLDAYIQKNQFEKKHKENIVQWVN